MANRFADLDDSIDAAYSAPVNRFAALEDAPALQGSTNGLDSSEQPANGVYDSIVDFTEHPIRTESIEPAKGVSTTQGGTAGKGLGVGGDLSKALSHPLPGATDIENAILDPMLSGNGMTIEKDESLLDFHPENVPSGDNAFTRPFRSVEKTGMGLANYVTSSRGIGEAAAAAKDAAKQLDQSQLEGGIPSLPMAPPNFSDQQKAEPDSKPVASMGDVWPSSPGADQIVKEAAPTHFLNLPRSSATRLWYLRKVRPLGV